MNELFCVTFVFIKIYAISKVYLIKYEALNYLLLFIFLHI